MKRLLFLTSLIVPATAGAFTQAQSASGVPLHWLSPHATVHLDPTAPSSQLSGEEVAEALDGALAVWNLADSRVQLDQGVPLALPAGSPVTCYLRFIQKQWPGAANQLATTQLWSHPESGQIAAAVINVNEADQQFATDRSAARSDLQAVLTHELGHLLGLGHSTDETATMYPQTSMGELDQRSLSADDLDGVHTIYDTDSTTEPQAGCSTVQGSHSSPLSLGLVLLFIGAAVASRRVRS